MTIKIKDNVSVSKPKDIAKIMQNILNSEEPNDQMKEHFWSIGLDSGNKILYLELVSLGTVNSNIVHPREVFRLAVQKSVVQIIIVHNHPSGNTEESEADILITARLKKAGEILGIEILDHLIITKDDFMSFKEKKKL